jgi:murein DD-endopeptidase MepM/ murein hydrolase activator NlpD
MKRTLWTLTASALSGGALGAAFLFAAVAPRVADAAGITEQIHAKQGEIHATHQKLDQKRAQLAHAKVRVTNLQGQLAETNRNIAQVGRRLELIVAQVAANEKRLAWNRLQLSAAQATLHRHNEALNRRLVDAYENGDLGYINVLLSATSFSDFVERWDDIRFLIAVNERTVRDRKQAEARVAVVQARLEGDAARLSDAEDHERRVRSQLAALAEERRVLVAAADEQRRHVAVEITELEEVSQDEENALEALIVQRQREEAARLAAERAAREAAREAARRAAQLAGQAVPDLPPPESAGGQGDLSWPVSGAITSGFGIRLDPVSGQVTRMHEGIDIAAPMGATIAAAADGRVIFAGVEGGYGNVVIIDHGNDLSTLYGHCSQLFVATGQDVQRGQAIAAVGSTGHSTGPHVHFEVRIAGKPIDPSSRLR